MNAGAVTMVSSAADFASASFTGTYGDFTVTVFSGASDNGATLSDLLSSTTSVTNSNLLTSGAHTLMLWVSQTNYSLPVGPKLNVESGLGGAMNLGTTVGLTGIFQAYADKNNILNGTTDFTNGPQTAIQTGNTFDTGSASGLFTRIATAYSLTSVVNFDLNGGGKGNFSDHINVTPTPAPAGVVLVLTAIPFLGIGAWMGLRGKRKLPTAA